jgi:hypothetical protein
MFRLKFFHASTVSWVNSSEWRIASQSSVHRN